MTYNQFKEACTAELNAQAAKIESGETRLGFGNQFTPYMIESALENLARDSGRVERAYKAEVRPDQCLSWLESFDAEEPSRAWTD